MPIVKINVLKGYSAEEKRELHDAVHNALVDTLHIETWDYFHRLFEFSKDDFLFPDMKSDKFILLEIHLFPGRTRELKKKLYTALYDNLEKMGIPRADVFIQIIEQPLENWGIRGGLPADEVFGKS